MFLFYLFYFLCWFSFTEKTCILLIFFFPMTKSYYKINKFTNTHIQWSVKLESNWGSSCPRNEKKRHGIGQWCNEHTSLVNARNETNQRNIISTRKKKHTNLFSTRFRKRVSSVSVYVCVLLCRNGKFDFFVSVWNWQNYKYTFNKTSVSRKRQGIWNSSGWFITHRNRRIWRERKSFNWKQSERLCAGSGEQHPIRRMSIVIV